MTNQVYIPFPKELYDTVVIRSGGKIDLSTVAEDLVLRWIENVKHDPDLWTEDGLALFAKEDDVNDAEVYGPADRGYQWQDLFLPNGAELRMKYKGEYHYAHIRHEKVASKCGARQTPSQWVSTVANDTARNAWRDIDVKLSPIEKWNSALYLRREIEKTLDYANESLKEL